MDLDQYRRAYMQIEGIGNTPLRAVQRAIKLAKNVVNVFSAMNKDYKDRRKRNENFREAVKGLREDGFSFVGIFDAAKYGGPNMSSHTSKALSRAGGSAINLAKSVNEFGSTAASIVGTKKNNLYDGQDMEKGAGFLLQANKVINSGLRASKGMLRGTGLVLESGAFIGDVITHKKTPEQAFEQFMERHSRGGHDER